MTYHIALKSGPSGQIVAECADLPGCIAHGRTEQEALDNITEAITAWMWDERRHARFALPIAV